MCMYTLFLSICVFFLVFHAEWFREIKSVQGGLRSSGWLHHLVSPLTLQRVRAMTCAYDGRDGKSVVLLRGADATVAGGRGKKREMHF